MARILMLLLLSLTIGDIGQSLITELNGEAAGIKVVAYEEDLKFDERIVSNKTDHSGNFTLTGTFVDSIEFQDTVEVFFHLGLRDICRRSIFNKSAFCNIHCPFGPIHTYPRTCIMTFKSKDSGRTFANNIDVCDQKEWEPTYCKTKPDGLPELDDVE